MVLASAATPLALRATDVVAVVNGTRLYGNSAAQTVPVVPNDASPFPMPTLYAFVRNAPSKTTSICWSLDITYADPYGDTNDLPSAITGETTGPAGEWNVNWNGADLGGTVTITATLNGCTGQTFSLTFYLVANDGANPTESQVDAITGCTANCSPWFLGSMIRWESGGKQFASNGYPTLNNNTNGTRDVGIAQVNNGNSTYFTDPSDSPFWNFAANIQAAQEILYEDEGLGQTCVPGGNCPWAYAFWDSQVNQMCAYDKAHGYPGAAYSAGAQTGDGMCSVVNPTPIWPGTFLPEGYCAFGLFAGQPSNYKDAELIKQYNGAAVFFIYWSGSGWSFDGAPNSYVEHVCGSTPF